MKNLSLLILVSFLCTVGMGACKKDPVSCNWAVELQEEANALSAAATVYGNNPTTANCEAFRDAYQDYLNEAEKRVDCATLAGQANELQNEIDQAQASLDNLQC